MTQVDDIAAVADLGQQHPDEETKSFNRLFFLQNLIIDNSNLQASFKVYFQVHHAMVETLYPLFTLQMASENGFQNFGIFLELAI